MCDELKIARQTNASPPSVGAMGATIVVSTDVDNTLDFIVAISKAVELRLAEYDLFGVVSGELEHSKSAIVAERLADPSAVLEGTLLCSRLSANISACIIANLELQQFKIMHEVEARVKLTGERVKAGGGPMRKGSHAPMQREAPGPFSQDTQIEEAWQEAFDLVDCADVSPDFHQLVVARPSFSRPSRRR
jgi:hypothetical protein